MSNFIRVFIILSICMLIVVSNSSAIDRVAAQYNVTEFSIGSAQPQGSYSNIGIGGYELIFDGGSGNEYDIDANDLYENSISVGLNYGRLINDNILFNLGFSYINAKHKEEFEDIVYIYTYPDEIKLRMYNIDFNYNYYLMSPVKESIAPYAGIGLQAGLLSAKQKNFQSESDFVLATAFNFGADLTIWKTPDKMSSLAISSINSYQFYASESRPSYMTIGFGLRYFMRP